MSAYKHPNKPGWQMIKISHGRKEKPEYIPFEGTFEEARMFEKEIRALADRSDLGFTDRIPEFKIAYRNKASKRGMEVIDNSFKHLEGFFKSNKMRHITPILIKQYKATRLKDGVKNGPSTSSCPDCLHTSPG